MAAVSHATLASNRPVAINRSGWGVVVALGFLASGPVLAPIFRASGLPLVQPIGNAIYWLGDLVCPVPAATIGAGEHRLGLCLGCYAVIVGFSIITALGLAGRLRLGTHGLPSLLLAVVTTTLLVRLFQAEHALHGLALVPLTLAGLAAGLSLALALLPDVVNRQ